MDKKPERKIGSTKLSSRNFTSELIVGDIEKNVRENFREILAGAEEKEITPEELRNIRKGIQKMVDEYEDRNPHIPYKEIAMYEQKLVSELVRVLQGKKEKFAYVFETEKGSLYFVLKSGEVMRIKKREGGVLTMEPICKHIYFIDETMVEEMKEAQKRGMAQFWMMNNEIRAIKKPQKGLRPLELVAEGSEDYEIVNTENGFVIQLTEQQKRKLFHNENPQFSSGYHIGHKII